MNPTSDTLGFNPSIPEVKTITLDNLFNSATRSLACQPGDIAGLTVGEYTITKIISQNGGHGLVVVCVDNSGVKWAMKIERENKLMAVDNLAMTEMSNHPANLLENNLHIPRLQKGFNQGGKEITVMDLLGPDVYSLQRALGIGNQYISMKSILQIGISLLHSLEEIHRAEWLHLSMKPINICIGGTPETRHKVYYVDFGRAEKYTRADGTHRPLQGAKRAGHEQFNSVWHNYSITASRRDDIMSLGLLLKDLEGQEELPWIGNGCSSLQQWLIYLEAWRYNRNLKPYKKLVLEASKMWYDDEPNYAGLRKYVEDYAKDHGIVLDGKYDWDHLLEEDDGRIVLRKE